ncbi:hypothetical protein TNCV_118841 [Trichonephila clavipes]|nr:hypothetical protein TNCV_118841 [Trichonephila clavipes]
MSPICERKFREMLFKPASSQLVLVRGTVASLESSNTVRITEQHKQMEVVDPSNSMYRVGLREVGTHTKDSKQCHEKTPQTLIEPPCLYTAPPDK